MVEEIVKYIQNKFTYDLYQSIKDFEEGKPELAPLKDDLTLYV